MSFDVPPSFASPEAEIAFWKAKALETREELEEFQESSKELENELEMQLEQSEKKIKEYRSLSNRLKMENDQLKERLEKCQKEYNSQVSDLQTELSEIKSIRDQLSKYVRELEQQNDDLERAKRVAFTSLEDFESRFNAAIERNALLESELDEKESLKDTVQRMKDEVRDLKQELKILNPKHPNLSSLDSMSFEIPDNDKSAAEARASQKNSLTMNNNDADSNKLAAELESKSYLDTPPTSSKSSPKFTNGETTMTPSTRVSALNIVGDLLRKVGALELKLVSCRNLVKENTSGLNSSSAGVPPMATPKSSLHLDTAGDSSGAGLDRSSRRLPRGSSTPSIKKAIDTK